MGPECTHCVPQTLEAVLVVAGLAVDQRYGHSGEPPCRLAVDMQCTLFHKVHSFDVFVKQRAEPL